MTETPTVTATPGGVLNDAHLYVGESGLEIHTFDSPLGSVAVAIAVSPEKTTPNEDSAALIPVNGDCLVLAVADGVGGAPTGRKASNTAVEELRTALKGVEDEDTRVRTAILDGMEAANHALLELGTGTATTLTVADIRANHVRTYHVGDSAAWLVGQRGVIKFQTTPHSPVGFGIEAGLIDQHEALEHEGLHEISNVVGARDMRIEIGTRFEMAARDTLLLASDGLFDNVLPNEIIDIIRTGSLEQNIVELWALASRRMAGEDKDKPCKPDDFSAILFRPAQKQD